MVRIKVEPIAKIDGGKKRGYIVTKNGYTQKVFRTKAPATKFANKLRKK